MVIGLARLVTDALARLRKRLKRSPLKRGSRFTELLIRCKIGEKKNLSYFKKTLDKSPGLCYNLIRKKRKGKTKMKTPKTQGTYYFADGYWCWYYGLSAAEKRNLAREHGPIVSFTPGQ